MTLGDSFAVLRQLDDAARGMVIPTLERAEKLVADARRELSTIDDPAARQAQEVAESALDDLRNAIYGSMVEYQRLTQDLSNLLRNN